MHSRLKYSGVRGYCCYFLYSPNYNICISCNKSVSYGFDYCESYFVLSEQWHFHTITIELTKMWFYFLIAS